MKKNIATVLIVPFFVLLQVQAQDIQSLATDTLPVFDSVTEYIPDSIPTYVPGNIWAFKSNLLFDAVSAINMEVEYAFAQHWSIAAEWVFPWWLLENKQHGLEILNGTLEGRYWLGQKPLDKWFIGTYAGLGLFDIEWDRKGTQGEFYIVSGLSAGYVHRFKENWALEFSAGLGYFSTNYRRYEARTDLIGGWHLIRLREGEFAWFGLSRLKVSIVWTPTIHIKMPAINVKAPAINLNFLKGGSK